jgi:hypothetical protein
LLQEHTVTSATQDDGDDSGHGEESQEQQQQNTGARPKRHVCNEDCKMTLIYFKK